MQVSSHANYSENPLVRRIARGHAALMERRTVRVKQLVDALVHYAERHPEVRHCIPAYYQRHPGDRPLTPEGLTARLDCDGNIIG